MNATTTLEGSMTVELKDGRQRTLCCSPSGGTVHHRDGKVAFGTVIRTPETEFLGSVRRIVSRSSYDRR